jgi:hypothetical protein
MIEYNHNVHSDVINRGVSKTHELNIFFSLPNRLFFMLASVKKSPFFHARAPFFHAGITIFHAGEKAGFGYSAVEGSLINQLRALYGQR